MGAIGTILHILAPAVAGVLLTALDVCISLWGVFRSGHPCLI
jgi:hypothetical protein